jgi:lysozyme
MTPSNKALQLIKNREKLRLTSYKLTGETFYTIGWGHYCDRTPTLNRAGAKITLAQADAFLVSDVKEKTSAIDRFLKVPINQDLYDALVSTVYQYNPSNKYLTAIFRLINMGYPVLTIAQNLMAMPSNSYNKKARKADALLATTGKVYHIDSIKV